MKVKKVLGIALSLAMVLSNVTISHAAESENREIPVITEENIAESEVLVQGKARVSGNVSAGFVSGYLSDESDVDTYQVTIPNGRMFQAQLAQPVDPGIDYDLYIFDLDGNLLDASQNVTYVAYEETLAENVGYINDSGSDMDCYVYVASYIGGSDTDAYTLTYAFTDVFDSFESDEQAWDAGEFIFSGSSDYSSDRNISSPIDCDWFMVTVPQGYDEMQISISTSSRNVITAWVYKNLATDENCQMAPVPVNNAKVEVSAGEVYYFKVSYSGILNDFAQGDIQNYTLGVSFSEKVLEPGSITISGYEGGTYVSYQYGRYYRVTGDTLVVKGVLRDTEGNPMMYAPVYAYFMNPAWEGSQYETVMASATTDYNGQYRIVITLPPDAGFDKYYVDPSTHYFDFCELVVFASGSVYKTDYIYQFAYSAYGRN